MSEYINVVLVAAAASWLTAQVLKTIIYAVKYRTFRLERIWGAGGMPSSHSAFVCSLAMMTCRVRGVNSVEAALAMSFAFIVMYDAMGVRRETGNQAKVINELRDLFLEMKSFADIPPEERLKELIGHTPLQVLVGAVLGVVIGIAVMYAI